MPVNPVTMLLVFALTLFTSATLLMMVQPMIGKMITPLLGGTPAVWNTCMVFFQALLLAGYSYSHVSTKYLGVRRQSYLHLLLLLTPFAVFAYYASRYSNPLFVEPNIITGGLQNPIPQLLLLLLMSVGVPFFVLSTTAPLLQKWFSSTTHPAAKDPYFLYAASNVGSMLGLLSYPVVIEPLLPVRYRPDLTSWVSQTWVFAIGYGVLVLLIGVCAVFMWRSPASQPDPEPEAEKELEPALALAGAASRSEGIQTASAKVGIARGRDKRNKRRYDRAGGGRDQDELSLTQELSGDVTWLRRLRRALLAAVASSMMLGATTYITTDIAAIPLLWVLPLALYLLSFIIVFSKIPPIVHKVFILLLPLTTLLLIFMMLAADVQQEINMKITYKICVHLMTLFVVSMVCHGDLAQNRPPTKYLTEFFLWMSFGGVVGGMFNGLMAPVVFNGIVEYEIAMVVACLLLPPLGLTGETTWGNYADLALAALCLIIGSILMGLRLWDNDIPFGRIENGPYIWLAISLALLAGLAIFNALRRQDSEARNVVDGVVTPLGLTLGPIVVNALGLYGVYVLANSGMRGWWIHAFVLPVAVLACVAANVAAVYFLYKTRTSDKRLQSWLDVLLPFSVMIFVIGLVWGLESDLLFPRVKSFAELLEEESGQIRCIIMYGVPAVLCYTFVERSLRFGLCVAALLMAAAFTVIFDDSTIFRERSFFGVLTVERGKNHKHPLIHGTTLPHTNRLVHGTTLHGTQFLPLTEEVKIQIPDFADWDTWPLTYYHRTGPIGQVCEAYNTSPDKNLAFIGLGSGTMSCYVLKGQKATYFDIDPVVRKITWDSDKYFTFVKQARDRGAHLNLVMGDARLTMERQTLADKDKYHLLVVDAFSSDAIPIHLITYEAILMYLDHMAEDGIICFHISNRHLNLKPVLGNLANKYRNSGKGNLVAYCMEDNEVEPIKAGSTWVALARDRKYLERLPLSDNWDRSLGLTNVDDKNPTRQWDLVKPALQKAGVMAYHLEPRWFPIEVEPKVGEWTDDYAPIFRVFSW